MGTFSDHPDPPEYYQAVQTYDVVRYTAVSEAPWFFDRIQFAYGSTNANVRFDTDGTSIRWFSSLVLRLGDWLYQGKTPITDAQLRTGALRPITETFPSGV